MERIAIHKQCRETRKHTMNSYPKTELGQQIRAFEDTFSGFELLRKTFRS